MRIALAAMAIAAAVAAPQIRVQIEGVRVDVLVTDGNTPVTSLTADDFELRDNGVVQSIQSIDIADVPISSLLVLDTSISVQGQPLEHLKEAAAALLGQLGTEDRAALISFSHEIRIGSPWTERPGDVTAALSTAQADGLTALHDAAYAAFILHDPQPATRRLILIFSDGEDTASWLPGEPVVELARRSDAVVYVVRVDNEIGQNMSGFRLQQRFGFHPSPGRVSPRDYFEPFLDVLTEETGGESILMTDTAQLRDSFLRVLARFRSRYLLSYTPHGVDASGWHTIGVRLKKRRADVRARRGYFRGEG